MTLLQSVYNSDHQVFNPAADFNGDGDFDHPAEHLAGGLSIDAVAGNQTIPFAVPASAVGGANVLRLRISSLGNLQPTGLAGDGEVEDHAITIQTLPSVEEVVLNQGELQRSNLTSVEVLFDRLVTAPVEAFSIHNRPSATAIAAFVVDTRIEESKTVARLTFPDGPLVRR